MKVQIKDNQKETKRTYPYLGISEKGKVVLFTSPKTGTLLKDQADNFKVGYVNYEWAEEQCFKPFTGTIELSND